MSTIPDSLRREIEWAVGALTAAGAPSPDALRTIHNAAKANSPMIAKRFQMFYDNAAPRDLERDDQNRVGMLLLALEARAKGQPWRLYQPGEFDAPAETKSDVLQIRCSKSWKARLRTYCERSGQDASNVIRKAVEAWLQDNPLWRGEETEETEEMVENGR